MIDLEESHGYIKYPQDPKLFFDLREVMEENPLSISDKVEFTVMPVSISGGWSFHAVFLHEMYLCRNKLILILTNVY